MLRCRVCNTPVKGEECYCFHCGSPLRLPGGLVDDALQAPAALPEKKRRLPLLPVLLALLVLAAAVFLLLRPGRPNFSARERRFTLWDHTLYLDQQPLAALTSMGNLQDAESAYSSVAYTLSQDGRTLLLYEMEPSTWTVYTADGDVIPLPDEFPFPFLSPDGSAVAAVAEDGLHHYDLSAGTDTLVEPGYDLEALKKGYTMNPCFAPDGSALAYAMEEDALFLWKIGESPRQVGTGTPVALSEGGDLLYFCDARGRFYVTDGTAPVLLASSADETYVFNADGTECLFCSDDRLYLSQNGGGAALLPLEDPADKFQLVLPAGGGDEDNAIGNALPVDLSFYENLRTFVGELLCVTTVYNSMSLVRLDSAGQVTILDERLSAPPARSADGSTLMWSTDDGLYCRRLDSHTQTEEVLSGDRWDESSYYLSPDGSACLLLNLYIDRVRLLDLASGAERAALYIDKTAHCLLSPDHSAIWIANQNEDGVIVEYLAWDGTLSSILDLPGEELIYADSFGDGGLVTADDLSYYLPPDGGPGTALSQP